MLDIEKVEALGAEALARMLLEAAQGNRALQKRLEVLTTPQSKQVAALRRQIQSLRRIRKFHDWRSIGKLIEKVEGPLDALESLNLDPRVSLELLVLFFQSDNNIFECCDDSSGRVSDCYRFTATRIFHQFAKLCDDKAWIAKQLFELLQDNGYGARDYLADDCDQFLPREQIVWLIDRYREKLRECESENESENDELATTASREPISLEPDVIGFETPGSETPGSRAAEEQAAIRRWDFEVSFIWRRIAEFALAARDTDQFEQAIRTSFRSGKNPFGMLVEIARGYAHCGDHETALSRLDEAAAIHDGRQSSYDYDKLRLQVLQQLGRTDELRQMQLDRLLVSPTLDALNEIVEADDRPSEGRSDVVQEVRARFENLEETSTGFACFLIDCELVDEAEEYLLHRASPLDFTSYVSWLPLAEAFERVERPLPASLIYRALILDILQSRVTKRYPIAVRYLKRLEGLAKSLDFLTFPDHAAFVESLRADHPRKMSFWSRVKSAGLEA